jgi:hypothetical protein
MAAYCVQALLASALMARRGARGRRKATSSRGYLYLVTNGARRFVSRRQIIIFAWATSAGAAEEAYGMALTVAKHGGNRRRDCG